MQQINTNPQSLNSSSYPNIIGNAEDQEDEEEEKEDGGSSRKPEPGSMLASVRARQKKANSLSKRFQAQANLNDDSDESNME